MSRAVKFEPDAWEDFNNLLEQDIKTVKRICTLLKDTKRNPFEGIGKPEPLKHNHSGYWSRRIDKVNRLVYKVTDDAIVVLSCKNHYA
jgi:toxin YoeB